MPTRKSPTSAEKKPTTRKAPTKKAAAAKAAAEPVAVETNIVNSAAADSFVARRTPTYEEIAALAEQFWNERGRPFGSPEVDWLRAESTLHAA